VEQTGREIFRLILAVAGGRPTLAEQLGLDNGLVLFNPAPVT
jgi:altronate dehydratase